MANNKLIIAEKQTDLGNFIVGRLLPFRQKRQVGPFTFIDHMGPAELGVGNYMDVDQHPHIGLSTLTYLFEGEIEHSDSTGAVQIISPGDVGFMTAGVGVTHCERTPQHARGKESIKMHGYQIWVALPKELESSAPRFDYFPSSSILKWSDGGLDFKLPAGQAFGRSAALQGYSPLFMVDIMATEDKILPLAGQLEGEVAFVIVKGEIDVNGEKVRTGQMLVSKTDDQCEICMQKGTQIMLFGGKPLPEERFLMWNFVSHDKKRLEKAKEDWEQKRFPKVPNDNTYIPFPSR